MKSVRTIATVAAILSCLPHPPAARADWLDDIGYTRLAAELGQTMPAASNVTISQIEAPLGGPSETNYMPDVADPRFAGKTFVNRSGISTNPSGHASMVGVVFYGTNSGIARSTPAVEVLETGHWLGAGGMNLLGTDPAVETNLVQCHAWIGSNSVPAETIRRLDYMIDRDGVTAVVGLNNIQDPIPLLLANSFHAITAGRSDGMHSAGTTTVDRVGRTKPDVVVPVPTTSEAVGATAGTAALIHDVVRRTPALSNAATPQCVKALILAGATKEEFPAWDRTPARPLDEHFGAGEINLYRSHHALVAGEQNPSSTSLVSQSGWNLAVSAGPTNFTYFIEVPSNHVLSRFSTVATWHRTIVDINPGAPFDPDWSCQNVDMFLHAASNFTVGTTLDSSTGRLDNIQHIYARYLTEGRYAIRVAVTSALTTAVAWSSTLVEIPHITGFAATDENVHLAVSVSSNAVYSLEATTSLLATVTWQPLATNLTASNTISWTDSTTNASLKFYRVRPDP